jgi:hypothetical protein
MWVREPPIPTKLCFRRPPQFACGDLSFVFPGHAFECSAIHLAASCSVMKPLITSVSPSGHKISTPQPDPGFFRATKVGRCSDILRICACGVSVQARYPAITDPLPGPNITLHKRVMDSLFAPLAGVGAEISENAPAAISESPRGIAARLRPTNAPLQLSSQ